ncbi:pentapeptide repeat-containing protein [Streptomyces echinatus]|uniref:pentapeptide repeat-containing protein n=1 Tax=Streptomyces echinatus TaxID=67293 RepID=UPI0037B2B6E6
MSTPLSPSWPHCGHGADTATDPVGCRGIHVPGHTPCLAHLTDTDRIAYLTGLAPGADIDHRGTPFTQQLLEALLNAVRDPATGAPHLGDAWFEGAQFSGDAGFEGAQFSGTAWFGGAQFSGDARFGGAQFSGTAGFEEAQFSGDARFGGAQFSGTARFRGAQFSGDAWFDMAQFSGTAGFDGAQFSGPAWFDMAQFSGTAWFNGAQFSGPAWFNGAQFSGDARFDMAQFMTAAKLGPLVCQRMVSLSGARFGAPASVEVAAARVVCEGTRWDAKGTLRLRYAALDLTDAVMEYPLSVTTKTTPFTWATTEVPEGGLAGTGPGAPTSPAVRVVSLSGADATHLALHNVDLAECRFFGTIHLDQLRLEGQCPLSPAATGWRWTRRSTLAEEHHWRASQHQRDWTAPPPGVEVHAPAALATVYRQLRKSFEDGKNEPGAADFYYGEMEMRRHDRTATSRAERGLLHAYWLLSGYGLRALRALGWLAAAMLITLVLLMGFGLPKDDPKQEATGTVPPGGGKVTFEIEKGDPQNPTGNRLTGKRFEKALNVTLNSVVFRSSGQDLTTAGTYIEMTSRLVEPALLALAVLAVRGRIKR